MNLAIDIGNTAVKWAAFEGSSMVDQGYGMPEGLLPKADRVLACASGAVANQSLPLLRSDTPLPIHLDYKTPDTLGADRVADACGAWALHRGEDCLVIDAGTCITVDFLDREGTYHGGAIMPGLQMNLRALHTFTAQLPLIELEPGRKAPVLGRSTEESIVAGTLGATLLALAGYVALYRQKCPSLRVLLTGGDAPLLAQGAEAGWEQVPLLSLVGLNGIMEMKNEK
ncbi:MAG: type III pantothenate kinase [Bacteroidales bacterium]|nr:type III pantothenate kinase [Bacteroidales bacterium]